MPPINRETFKKYCRETEIIRHYDRMLLTFGDMKLPYIFAGEHHLRDRVVVMKGVVLVQKPIMMRSSGSQFKEGFEHADTLPSEVISIFRRMGLPYCHLHNKLILKQEIEYDSLQGVLDKYNKRLEAEKDTKTGLIKGVVEGADISLMLYSIELAAKSTPGNIDHFMEHLTKQRMGPFNPGETITDDDIRRLLG